VACNNANLNKDVVLSKPVNLVEVHNELTISCNANANCTALVSGLENRFSEVMPAGEPSSLALLGAGLPGFFMLAQRGKRPSWRRIASGASATAF
jgi:hypothetical protein